MMQCVSLSTQKRQHSTWPCLHVMVCTNASCCMVGECERVFWCGVVGAGKKGKRQTHSQTKTKRTFPKTTFSLFPFFPLFLPPFSSCLPLFHHHPLLINTHTFPCLVHGCIRVEPKTQMTQHLILFTVFSFVQTLFFSSFHSVNDSMLLESQYNTIKSSNNIHLA